MLNFEEALMLRQFVKAAKVNDLQDDQMKAVLVNGRQILLARVNGAFYAVSNECTHIAMPLDQGKLVGCTVQCPLHESRFDLRTGAALCEPAEDPLLVYDVKIVGEDVLVGPKETSLSA